MLKQFLRPTPLISLLHTCARVPDGWLAAFKDWKNKAENPARIEYVLCVDQGALTLSQIDYFRGVATNWGFGSFKIVENTGRRCAVDGWNTAAAASTGKLLITVSDDLFPPARWDTELLTAVADLDREAVVDIEAGSGALMTFSLLTRAYYERYGYIFYPEYLGMLGDNDFTDQAHKDGVVVPAKHLVFTHNHPAYKTAEMDAVYEHQHRTEAWRVGKAVYKKRWPQNHRDVLALCVPGENFNNQWVANWSTLLVNMCNRFHCGPNFSYCSNVHITRLSISEALTRGRGPNAPPDLVLWVDDDNLPTVPQFDLLYQDLQDRPDLDMVVGWCWAGFKGTDPENPRVSCGHLDENNLMVHMGYQDLFAGSEDLVSVSATGFPFVLMRYDALEKAGGLAFAPVLNAKHPWGFNSEDTSFCINARDRGQVKMACDRRVKVQHLKTGFDEPAGFAAKPVRTETAA